MAMGSMERRLRDKTSPVAFYYERKDVNCEGEAVGVEVRGGSSNEGGESRAELFEL